MNKEKIEEKRNKLNLDIRIIISIIDMIDGNTSETEDYITNSLNEEEFLDQQINMIEDAKNRLLNVFKE